MERLLEHERFKNAAQMLQQKQMLEAATWTNPGMREFKEDAARGRRRLPPTRSTWSASSATFWSAPATGPCSTCRKTR